MLLNELNPCLSSSGYRSFLHVSPADPKSCHESISRDWRSEQSTGDYDRSVFGYYSYREQVFLKEKSHLKTKIIAVGLATIGAILIRLAN